MDAVQIFAFPDRTNWTSVCPVSARAMFTQKPIRYKEHFCREVMFIRVSLTFVAWRLVYFFTIEESFITRKILVTIF